MLDLRASVIAVSYIVASVLFIFGLKQLSSPATARSGNRLAAIGMALALAATLIDRQIISFWTIAIGTLIGAAMGIYFGRTVQMTAMPQMVALFNGMGGATAALVSVAEYLRLSGHGEVIGVGEATSIVLGTAIGAISFTGSSCTKPKPALALCSMGSSIIASASSRCIGGITKRSSKVQSEVSW